jgi:hypothetical protein
VRYPKQVYRVLKRESEDRDLEPLFERGKGSGTFQALVENAIELYLSVPAGRHAAGDIQRLKDYAAFLAKPSTSAHDAAVNRIAAIIAGDPDVDQATKPVPQSERESA